MTDKTIEELRDELNKTAILLEEAKYYAMYHFKAAEKAKDAELEVWGKLDLLRDKIEKLEKDHENN